MKHSLLTIFLLATLLALSASPVPTAHAATSTGFQLNTPAHPSASLRTGATTRVQPDWGRMPLYFVINQGQMDARVAYYVQGSDKVLYFTNEGVTFALTNLTPAPLSYEERGWGKGRWIVKLDFVDANAVRPSGQAQTGTAISYFKGSPDEWHTGLPTYAQIVYRNLWEGIDLAYSGTVNRLKYEFIVQPGADPARIRLAYRGAIVRLNEEGQLEASTPAGGFQDDAPIAYQEVDGQRVPVAVAYALEDGATYGFNLGSYDPTLPLVIDPAVLVYCGYIGGSGDDSAKDIAVDSAGNAYVVGDTYSTEATFPVAEDGNGIAVDSAGNAYVTGMTWSNEATFPVLVGPDLTHNGGQDAFVAKVKADGTGLLYCGYIGGGAVSGIGGNEGGQDIAIDTAGNAYVSGATNTREATFPVLVGPDLTFNGDWDTFVAKVKADGTGLIYCGYIGGNGLDYDGRIAVDEAGNAYVTATTVSSEATFPVLVGPDLTHNGGTYDAYVAKVKADGSGLVFCGYIGGSDYDSSYNIAVDSTGNAYVTGRTRSNETIEGFPVLIGPDLTYNSGDYDAYVAKVKADGTGLVYAGYIGGSGVDEGRGIAVTPAGDAYVTGLTDSSQATFPVTSGPDLTYNGNKDAFVAKVKADGTGLVYAGYIGGNETDDGMGIAVDSAGNAYVTGSTKSSEATFPVTVGPDLIYNGVSDAFVAKVSYTPSINLYLPLILK